MKGENASLLSGSEDVEFKEALNCRGRSFSGSTGMIGLSVMGNPLTPFKQKIKDRKQNWRYEHIVHQAK